MEQLTIDDIKTIELDIMDEIDRVCAEHGLQYFLDYGSLLGAVRHGGFIPWDDDINILMMREAAPDPTDDARVIDVLGGASEAKAQRRCLFEPVRVPFENRQYWAPAGYEEYLTVEYGDWRTPPAENDRPIHTMEAYRL